MLHLGILVLLVTVPMVFTASLNQEQKSIVRVFDIRPASFNMTGKSQREQVIISYEPYELTWEKFKIEYSKSYHSTEEETYRREVFQKNVLVIEEHNKQYRLGKRSFYLGINQFADMELWEYTKYHGFLQKKMFNKTRDGSTFLAPSFVELPDSVDWREKGYVTPVKNQGRCGSCWAFSTTGSLEGQHFKKTGTLLSLSEQQLVDCSGDYGNEGCNGGLVDRAFAYIKNVGGLETEANYPYRAKDGSCMFDESLAEATVKGFTDIDRGSESALKTASATVGPISVAIDANHQSFQLYSGGVYDEPECRNGRFDLDHAVLVVGYGTDGDSGEDYWLVKNSWGESWGDEGYIKMTRNNNNQCGIATAASYPLV